MINNKLVLYLYDGCGEYKYEKISVLSVNNKLLKVLLYFKRYSVSSTGRGVKQYGCFFRQSIFESTTFENSYLSQF